MNKLTVDNKSSGVRLDLFLSEYFKNLSRSVIQQAIHSADILVNGKLSKPSAILKNTDVIEFSDSIGKPQEIEPANDIKIEIIFENDDFLIINKPVGLVVHPAHANTSNTLVNYLVAMRPDIKNVIYDKNKQVSLSRPGIVHRLDKDTSGLMVVAKNKATLTGLSRLIHNHKIKKYYLALVHGFAPDKGIITGFIKRSSKDRRKMELANIGRESETQYKVIKYYQFKTFELSLIEAQPITGRTHQIRVHLESIGHPIVGDNFYGLDKSKELPKQLKAKSQLLHAYKLEFRYKGKDYSFASELPHNFDKILKNLKEINAH